MKIIKAKIKDIPQVSLLMQKADKRSKDWANKKSEQFINDNKKIRLILLAKIGKKFVGYAGLKKEEENDKAKKFVNLKKSAHLTWIAVLPNFRKNKIGTKILKKCDFYAKKFRKDFIWLDCRKDKVSFYEKNNYYVKGKYVNNGRFLYVLEKRLE